MVLDEFQNVPKLLSYIQIISDEKKKNGYFVLTGSQNFHRLFPVKIKSGETIHDSFFSSLSKWNKLSETNSSYSTIIYAGNKNQKRKWEQVVSWQHAGQYISHIENI